MAIELENIAQFSDEELGEVAFPYDVFPWIGQFSSSGSSGLEDHETIRFLPIDAQDAPAQIKANKVDALPHTRLSLDDSLFDEVIAGNMPSPLVQNFVEGPTWSLTQQLNKFSNVFSEKKYLIGAWLLVVLIFATLFVLSQEAHQDLSWRGSLALLTFITEAVVLVARAAPPHLVFFSGMSFLFVVNVNSSFDTFSGFSNEGLIIVVFFYVISKTIFQTKVLHFFCTTLLGYPKTTTSALMRTLPLFCLLSSVCDNTDLVAISVNILSAWGKQCQIPISQMLMPLNYMVTAGGCLSLIGGFAGVVGYGLVRGQDPDFQMNIFSLSLINGPVCIAFFLSFFFLSPLLPSRTPFLPPSRHHRKFCSVFFVTEKCYFVGKKVSETPIVEDGATILQVVTSDGSVKNRESGVVYFQETGSKIVDVHDEMALSSDSDFDGVLNNPENHVVQTGDVLYIVCSLEFLLGVSAIDGLIVSKEEMPNPTSKTSFIEAVVSSFSQLTRVPTTRSSFCENYGANILGFHREGRLFFVDSDQSPFKLEPKDVLLLKASQEFTEAKRENLKDFSQLSTVKESIVEPTSLMLITITAFFVVLVLISAQIVDLLRGVVCLGCFYLLAGLISFREAAHSIDWKVVVTIGCGVACGRGVSSSGAGAAVAGTILHLFSFWGGVGGLVGLYVVCLLLGSVVSDVVTILLIFPFAWEFVVEKEIDPRAMLVVLVVASCSCFASPIGSRANLLVNQVVRYSLIDYLKIGVPLVLISLSLSLLMVFLVYLL